MSRRKDWTGQKFNRLTFLRPNANDYSRWAVLCDCGTELEVFSNNVRRGLTKSCGCLNSELASVRFKKEAPVKDDPSYVAKYNSDYREKNRTALLEKKRVYNRLNRERLAETKRRCYARNREDYLRRAKQNYAADPEKTISRERLKSTLKKDATPSWCDIEQVKALYRHARALTKETGVLHHVDHIIPLRHELVCGLHVHNNLRVIPAHENWRKRNKFDADGLEW